jgi:GNAT superfamily N-acetyltransferase
MVVRGYEPGDRDALLVLAGRLVIGVAPWRDAQAVSDAVRQWVADSIATATDGRGALFVATDQAGQVQGFVSVSERRHFAGAVDAYVGELVTAEDAEGQGVGRTLLGRAEEWAREHDYPRITWKREPATSGCSGSMSISVGSPKTFVSARRSS